MWSKRNADVNSRTWWKHIASAAHSLAKAYLVYQVLSSNLPGCLADDIHLASESSARSLRSSSGRKCSVTRVHSRFGDRYFAAAGPRIRNNLPASLRDKEVSCTEFRKQLKTFMFQTDCGASWLFWLLRLISTLTYLLTYLLQHNTTEHASSRSPTEHNAQLCVDVHRLIFTFVAASH